MCGAPDTHGTWLLDTRPQGTHVTTDFSLRIGVDATPADTTFTDTVATFSTTLLSKFDTSASGVSVVQRIFRCQNGREFVKWSYIWRVVMMASGNPPSASTGTVWFEHRRPSSQVIGFGLTHISWNEYLDSQIHNMQKVLLGVLDIQEAKIQVPADGISLSDSN